MSLKIRKEAPASLAGGEELRFLVFKKANKSKILYEHSADYKTYNNKRY